MAAERAVPNPPEVTIPVSGSAGFGQCNIAPPTFLRKVGSLFVSVAGFWMLGVCVAMLWCRVLLLFVNRRTEPPILEGKTRRAPHRRFETRDEANDGAKKEDRQRDFEDFGDKGFFRLGTSRLAVGLHQPEQRQGRIEMGWAVVGNFQLHPQVRGEDRQPACQSDDFIRFKEFRREHKPS